MGKTGTFNKKISLYKEFYHRDFVGTTYSLANILSIMIWVIIICVPFIVVFDKGKSPISCLNFQISGSNKRFTSNNPASNLRVSFMLRQSTVTALTKSNSTTQASNRLETTSRTRWCLLVSRRCQSTKIVTASSISIISQ